MLWVNFSMTDKFLGKRFNWDRIYITNSSKTFILRTPFISVSKNNTMMPATYMLKQYKKELQKRVWEDKIFLTNFTNVEKKLIVCLVDDYFSTKIKNINRNYLKEQTNDRN